MFVTVVCLPAFNILNHRVSTVQFMPFSFTTNSVFQAPQEMNNDKLSGPDVSPKSLFQSVTFVNEVIGMSR
ncbi:hypothetical protein AHF37_04145 [Paragonimus kellicotti]|nr:hypothetical protein AHF37_04145 [Paragonimus kellicotti]